LRRVSLKIIARLLPSLRMPICADVSYSTIFGC